MMPPPLQPTREDARAYLLDMIGQLAKLARGTDEMEIEILLKATLDVVRESDRRRSVSGERARG